LDAVLVAAKIEQALVVAVSFEIRCFGFPAGTWIVADELQRDCRVPMDEF
jgi:hypothetical protein